MTLADTQNKCLIVDDDGYIRVTIERHLLGLLDVTATGSSTEALELFKSNLHQIALIDYHMPELEGIELVDKIHRLNPSTHIIVITADATEQNRQTATAHGASGFIAKPFTKNDLMQHVLACPQLAWSDKGVLVRKI